MTLKTASLKLFALLLSNSLLTAGFVAAADICRYSLGDVTVAARRVFEESFEDLDNWINLAPRTVWVMDNGVLKGHWAPGGSALWLDREFRGNILLIAEGKVLPPDPAVRRNRQPDGGRNFNIRFHVRGPNGADILDAYPDLLRAGTGRNGVGDDQYLGYFATWTGRHSRLRKSPGYHNVSEDRSYLPELNRTHRIQILFLDGRILYTADGRVLHDYTDSQPFRDGRIGILTWNSNIEVSRFEVYQVLAAAPEK